MYNNSIEDIMIDKNYDKRNKKGGSILIILFILILLSVLAVVGYSYFTNMNKETNKQLFLKGISNADLKFFLENETYEEMLRKISNDNYEMTNELSISTTMENELLSENTDISKYLLNWTTIQNVENEEIYNELNLSYSDNKLLNIKMINNKENVAIISDEIVNKYVGINKNNVKPFLERIGFETTMIDEYSNKKSQITAQELDLEEATIQTKKEEYINFLLEKLGEEKFTSQENVISLVKENSDEVIVNAYTLSLTQSEYAIIAKEFLTKLKNDKEFIQNFVIISEENEVIDAQEENEEINNQEENEEINNQEEFNENTSDGNIITIPNLEPIGTESNLEEQESFDSSVDNFEEQTSFDSSIELQTEDTLADIKEKLLINILLGRKTDVTLEEIEKVIDETIENISGTEGNGLKIIVYVSENSTEKISISFPDESTIDIEFNPISDIEKNLVFTYLYEQKPVEIEENDVTIFSATDNTITQEIQKNLEPQTNGVKLELYKSQNTASTTIKAVCNIIEDKEINQKISLNLNTKGTTSSKNFSNEFIVTYSNNDGEIKANITNEIDFDKVSEIEKLTEENCLLLDTLSDEELQLTLDNIKAKIAEVYIAKQENLNFIDTNTQAPGITANNVNREELRNLLVTTVSTQMGEAQSRGEEYTLQNLLDLYIQGHMVTVVIQADVAEISIDGVKFRIDQNFNLTDA